MISKLTKVWWIKRPNSATVAQPWVLDSMRSLECFSWGRGYEYLKIRYSLGLGLKTNLKYPKVTIQVSQNTWGEFTKTP